MTKFVVKSPAQGLRVIKHPDITKNYEAALRWKPKHKKAVLIPCAQTKPFPSAPSHSGGYLPALEGKAADVWVVSEPLGIVPYAWSLKYPNADYDFPPKHLTGEAHAELAKRVARWFKRVGRKYQKVTLALPAHHMRLVDTALAQLEKVPTKIARAGIGECLEAGACPKGHYRATSKAYRGFLRKRANPANPIRARFGGPDGDELDILQPAYSGSLEYWDARFVGDDEDVTVPAYSVYDMNREERWLKPRPRGPGKKAWTNPPLPPAQLDIFELYPETRSALVDGASEEAVRAGLIELDRLPQEDRRAWFYDRTGTLVRRLWPDLEHGAGVHLDYGITLVRDTSEKAKKAGQAARGALTRKEIRSYVKEWHRHLPDSPATFLWAYGVYNGPPGELRIETEETMFGPVQRTVVEGNANLLGVAMIGLPARKTMEAGKAGTGPKVATVTRVALDHQLPREITYEAASMVYDAAAQEAWGRGYDELETFTLASESGASMRYANWAPPGMSKTAARWRRVKTTRVEKKGRRKVRKGEAAEAKTRWVKKLRPAATRSVAAAPSPPAPSSPEEILCMRCGAKPGVMCRTRSGKKAAHWHGRRNDDWNQILGLDPTGRALPNPGALRGPSWSALGGPAREIMITRVWSGIIDPYHGPGLIGITALDRGAQVIFQLGQPAVSAILGALGHHQPSPPPIEAAYGVTVQVGRKVAIGNVEHARVTHGKRESTQVELLVRIREGFTYTLAVWGQPADMIVRLARGGSGEWSAPRGGGQLGFMFNPPGEDLFDILQDRGEVDASSAPHLTQFQHLVLSAAVHRDGAFTVGQLAKEVDSSRIATANALNRLTWDDLVVSEVKDSDVVWLPTVKGAHSLELLAYLEATGTGDAIEEAGSQAAGEQWALEQLHREGPMGPRDFDPELLELPLLERIAIEDRIDGPYVVVEAYDWTIARSEGASDDAGMLVGEIWLTRGPSDDRDFGGVSAQYAAIKYVRIADVPGLHQLLYQRAAKKAGELGLRLASATDPFRDQWEFWDRQERKGRAFKGTYKGKTAGGKSFKTSRYFLDHPAPPSLDNPPKGTKTCERCLQRRGPVRKCCGWHLCDRCTDSGMRCAIRKHPLCKNCVTFRQRMEERGAMKPGSVEPIPRSNPGRGYSLEPTIGPMLIQANPRAVEVQGYMFFTPPGVTVKGKGPWTVWHHGGLVARVRAAGELDHVLARLTPAGWERAAPLRMAANPEGEEKMQVVCAWCKAVIRRGILPVSHGICAPCKAKMLDEVDPEERENPLFKKPCDPSNRPLKISAVKGKKVRVHLNLHNGCYVVSLKGKVQGYLHSVTIKNVTAKVQPAGYRRCRDKKVRNVHAYLEGTLAAGSAKKPRDWRRLSYNCLTHPPCFFYTDDESCFTSSAEVRGLPLGEVYARG